MTSPTGSGADISTPHVRAGLSGAQRIIDGLAARDLDAVVDALNPDVVFRALLPSRSLTVEDAVDVRTTLDTWFGGARGWELTEAAMGTIGGRIHLGWRVRMTHPGVGPGTYLVDQQAFADADTDGRLHRIALLCSGYLREDAW